jgi:hypothetical protein
MSNKCCCPENKFCKSCYSKLYYKENKQDILDYQKEKYHKVKVEKHTITFKFGSFDPFKNDR